MAESGQVAGLDVIDLHQRFGKLVALDGVSLSVAEGEIVGLVGRNGAGKTTTMRAVTGILRTDSGEVRWLGRPVGERERLRFGYMPEERGLYPQMSLLRQVVYFARLHGLDADEANRAAREWVERLGLGERMNEKLVALSHGNQQRVQLAVALVHSPDLLVLDEPFAGLDPEAVDSLSQVMLDQTRAGISVLFSSHQLELVERVCKRVVIVEAGKVIADGTLEELRRRLPAQLRVKVDAPPDWAHELPGTELASADENGVLLVVQPGTDPQAILHAAQAAGPVQQFGFETAGLIDLYRRMVGGGDGER
jgi:ABC-2 type transport system ATP-binding protein